MKCLIILSDGFEDTEAIATIDVLTRSGLEVHIYSFDSKTVTTQLGLSINIKQKNINLDIYKALIIPGGKAVEKVLLNNEKVNEIILKFSESNKLIAAICAAPKLLLELNLLDDKIYTCYPGYQSEQGEYTDCGVVVSNNIITAKSVGFTIPFALEIVRYLLGDEKLIETENNIYAKK